MDAALVAAAGLMGLAGIPHCAAMCAAPCAAVTLACSGGRGAAPALWGWQVGRVLSYALAGALVAASVAVMTQLGSSAVVLRPLWGMAHAAAFAFGAWMVWSGHWPAWVDRPAQRLSRWAGIPTRPAPGEAAVRDGVATLRWNGAGAALGVTARATTAGGLWALMPCGLLQSALLIAALASGPAQGAAVMGVFGLASASGPWLGPALLLRFRGNASSPAWATRLAGASLMVASGWAVGHGVWQQVVQWCT